MHDADLDFSHLPEAKGLDRWSVAVVTSDQDQERHAEDTKEAAGGSSAHHSALPEAPANQHFRISLSYHLIIEPSFSLCSS
jgi:hypothetical protein